MLVASTGRLEPRVNRLLAALRPQDYARLRDSFDRTAMPIGRVVHEPGRPLAHVYFPVDCIVAMMYVTRDGSSIETALAGRDGLVGIEQVLGGNATPNRAVVQNGGTAYCVPAEAIMQLFEASAAFRALLLSYAQFVMAQMSQTAVCSRHHSLDQQLCRWILMSADRLDEPTLEMTHERVASLLGVRREGISDAAARLREAGLIEYRRRRIRLLDRAGVEARACECYNVVRAEERRLLAPSTPWTSGS